MAANVETLNSEVPISRRIILWAVALLGIFVLTGSFLAFNYWVAVSFFFVSLLILIRFGLEEHEWRGLWLLLVTCLFVAVLVGSLALLFLSNDPRIPQLAQDNSLTNFFLGSNVRIILTSILIGLIAPLPLVIIPFLLLVAVATFGILQWHKIDQKISTLETFWYVLFGLLGILHFSIIIEKEEIKGSDKAKERLVNLGGPGWLTVYPGQVVVLHKWGKITRVVGQESIMLGREEQIKAIVPLGGKGGPNTVENVLTRDRIPVKITISHALQVEPAQEMRKRLLQETVEEARQQLQRATNPQEIQEAQRHLDEVERRLQNFQAVKMDSDVGDDYDQCDENLAKLVATKVALKENTYLTDIWESMKGSIAGNLRDVIMSCGFEELFDIAGVGGNLGNNIQSRKIAEIEEIILDKAKGSGLSKGLVLRSVDIGEIRFPEQIEEKIKTEMTALAEARVKETEARIMRLEAEAKSEAKVMEARAERTAAEDFARAALISARADAQAETLNGQAKARYYQGIVQALQQQGLTPTTIGPILQNMASSAALQNDLKRILELTVHYIHGEHTGKADSRSLSDRS